MDGLRRAVEQYVSGTRSQLEDDLAGTGITDLADVTISSVADAEVLQYDSGTSEWINQTLAEAGISAVGHTHDHGALTGLGDDDHTQYHTDARALTWLGTRSTTDLSEGSNLYYTNARADARIALATLADLASADASELDAGVLADARVQESNVTQHQAALSITELQINDLDHYDDADADARIALADLSDLASASASDIDSGTLADARLSSNVPLLDAENEFSADQTILHSGVTGYRIESTDSSAICELQGEILRQFTFRYTGGIRNLIMRVTQTDGDGDDDGGDLEFLFYDDSNSFIGTALTMIRATAGVRVDGPVGFYGTTPIAKQTSVAVSAAGIHAALVNLGLIT